MSRTKASIWAPDTEQSMMRSNRQVLCVGHYVNGGSFDKPSSGGGLFSSKSATECFTIEAKDEGRWGMTGSSEHFGTPAAKRRCPRRRCCSFFAARAWSLSFALVANCEER